MPVQIAQRKTCALTSVRLNKGLACAACIPGLADALAHETKDRSKIYFESGNGLSMYTSDGSVQLVADIKSRAAIHNSSVALLNLPPELRNRIWALLLPTCVKHLNVYNDDQEIGETKSRQPAILRVCKAMRNDTLALYYGNNLFQPECNMNRGKGLEVAKLFLRNIGQGPLEHTRHLTFSFSLRVSRGSAGIYSLHPFNLWDRLDSECAISYFQVVDSAGKHKYMIRLMYSMVGKKAEHDVHLMVFSTVADCEKLLYIIRGSGNRAVPSSQHYKIHVDWENGDEERLLWREGRLITLE